MSDILNDVYTSVTYQYRMNASTLLAKSADSIGKLRAAGWDTDIIKRHSGSNWVPEFGVLHREVELTPDGKPSPNTTIDGEDLPESAAQSTGVKLSPSTIPSIGMLRKKGRRFVVALDTEFYYPRKSSYERLVLSWQLCFQVPGQSNVLHEVIFYSLLGKRISVEQALAYVIDRFDIASAMTAEGATKCPSHGYRHKDSRVWTVPTYDTKGALWKDRPYHKSDWKVCKSFDDARASCGDPEFSKAYRELARRHKHPEQVRLDPNGSKSVSLAGYTNDYAPYHRNGGSIPVTLLCHFGRADLTAFGLRRHGVDVIRMTSQVQRGHVTLEDFPMEASHNIKYWRFYPLDVQVRDTMCMAPAKARSLATLGESIGIPKLDLPAGYDKERMDKFLDGDPVGFMDYAAQDSLVTLMYAATLFGMNRDLPVTASSAGVATVIGNISRTYGLRKRDEFDRWLKGLERVHVGMQWNGKARCPKPRFEIRSLTDSCHLLQETARQSYKGGLNGCAGPGWITGHTYDLDLMSAYPTAMCCVYDVDWGADDVIERDWQNCQMKLTDFDDPLRPMFAYVDDFEFPADCKFPCLPMNIEGKLVYTRKLGDRDGIWVTGVEIWLALKMGATVHVSRAYRAKVRKDASGKPTRALFHAVDLIVRDRTMVERHLKDQPELAVFEQLLKQVVNSVYGKLAQGVLEKHSWDAFEERMVDIGCSGITSPAHCSMTTAIVRCTLLAAMAELNEMGYNPTRGPPTASSPMPTRASSTPWVYSGSLTDCARRARTSPETPRCGRRSTRRTSS